MLLAAGAVGCTKDKHSGSAEKLCSLLGDGSSFTALVADFDPTDTDRALEQLHAVQIELARLQAAAPGDAHRALGVELDYIDALIAGLEKVDVDDATAAAAAVNALSDQAQAANRAAADLQVFQNSNC